MRLGGERRQQDGGANLIEIVPGLKVGLRAALMLFAAVFVVGIAILGFGNVEITEFALNYSLLTRKVERKTYTSGRYWISPFNYFVKFPAIVRTVQFSDSQLQSDLAPDEHGDVVLRSRTNDGLDVSIELSFQYQLNHSSIYNLYTELGPSPWFHNTFVRVAIDRLTEMATKYTANEFFIDRTEIGKAMEADLKTDFERRLHSTIFSFQLRSVGLPAEFEDAIQQTEVKKQDVQVARAEQNSTHVSLDTQLMQAKRRTKVKLNKGEAIAASTMLANAADITQYNSTQVKSADGYAGVIADLDGKEQDLLAYMETRVMREHASDKSTIGLSLPSAVVTA